MSIISIKDIIKSGMAILTAILLFTGCETVSSSHDVAGIVSDISVDDAIKMVSGEGPPMQGISALIAYADAAVPNIKATLWLGRFGVQSGQLEKAHARFSKVLELEPNHLEATWDLAMLDMQMGSSESAANGFKVCVNRDPGMYKGYFFLATCLKNMDKPVEALEQYRTFLPLTTDSVLQMKVKGIINRLEVDINVVSDPNE
jgi:hypothetical protein